VPLKFQIDAEAIAAQFKEFMLSVKEDLQKSMSELAFITRTRILEEAQSELQTTRKTYEESLSEVTEVSPGVWVIALDEKAMYIEEGIEAGHDMKPDLLKGKKYRVIPFRYDKGPSQNTPSTQALISQIRQTLKKNKLTISKLEYEMKDGVKSPRMGKLHEYNLGGPRPGKGNTPALTRLSIYQSEKNGKVKRDVLTFRTVSAGPASAGKWIHPGLTAKKYMDKALDKATADWEEQILPAIMEKWGSL
jgi:hypothetical protein